MKTNLCAALAAILSCLSAPALGDCQPASAGYASGFSMGRYECGYWQVTYAHWGFAGVGHRFFNMCDAAAVVACRAGFRDGFRSGAGQTINGTAVPSCAELLQASWGGISADYERTIDNFCSTSW